MAQQVNTFTNGMNIDADINMISNNQYRYAQNIKISSDDSSTYGALTASEFIKRYWVGYSTFCKINNQHIKNTNPERLTVERFYELQEQAIAQLNALK